MPNPIFLFDIVVILSTWHLKAINDAILFGKVSTGNGEPMHEVWHILDWVRSWGWVIWFAYRVHLPLWAMLTVGVLSFFFNYTYVKFRSQEIWRWDDNFRVKWLGRILDRGGVV
jgi:hypothetical protein